MADEYVTMPNGVNHEESNSEQDIFNNDVSNVPNGQADQTMLDIDKSINGIHNQTVDQMIPDHYQAMSNDHKVGMLRPLGSIGQDRDDHVRPEITA